MWILERSYANTNLSVAKYTAGSQRSFPLHPRHTSEKFQAFTSGPLRDFFASHLKVQAIKTDESVSPHKENLHLMVKVTETEQINLTTSNHEKGLFVLSPLPR